MLEDNHEDIIAKAMRGQKIGKSMLADLSGLEKTEVESLLKGKFSEKAILEVANQLKLDERKLLISAKKSWLPDLVDIPGLKRFESKFGDMKVNAYVIYNESSKKSWIFDTGTDCNALLTFIKEQELKVDSIFLTHSHRDHIACLSEILEFTRFPKFFIHNSEKIKDSNEIDEGFNSWISDICLTAFHTHGHSVGGMTYLISGLTSPVAIVGDAIFAGSMGGGIVSYPDALETNRSKIMTFSDETVLCPGHGPQTTVGEEKKYNPFFPEF